MDENAPPKNELDRLDALERYEVLDTPAEAAFDRLTDLAATFYQCPIALVSLVDIDRQWFKSRVGLDALETPRDLAFCHHTIQSDEPLIVPNALKDDRFKDNPLVTGEPDIRFYAGAPLITPNGQRIGSLCIIDREPHEDFAPGDTKQLRLLADIVISELELRIKNKELEKAKQAAEAASAAKSQFLAMISHEVRTPLNAIIGLSDALTDTTLNLERQSFVDGIVASGRMVSGLVNDILDMAKIEAGKIQIVPTDTDLDHLVTTLRTVWQPSAGEKGLTFMIEVADDLPRVFSVDDIRLNQIVNNLIGNAIKFTASGSVSVHMKNARTPDAPILQVQVTDTGPGMTAAQQQALFQPFEQASVDIHKKYGGTGLGLAITKRLVGLMGGDISVESRPGEGSTFRVDIPVESSVLQDGSQTQNTQTTSLSILAADDVPLNLQILKHMLEHLGHTVETASNGAEAVAAAAEIPFDFIFLDIHMPEKNGLDATETIRASAGPNRDTPIVALSADAEAGDQETALAAGMNGYLVKPVTPEKLAGAILRHR